MMANGEEKGESDLLTLQEELNKRDDIIFVKNDVIASLKKTVERLEIEIGDLWERIGKLGEEKREMEMQMALVQEEASRSLTSMVAAQQGKRKDEEKYRERKEQLEVQVVSQADEIRHLRAQLVEEAQAHRDDVADCEKRAQRQLKDLRLQLRRAKNLGVSVSQPNISSATLPYNTLLPPASPLSPRSPRSPRHEIPPPSSSHMPLLHTVSEGPPSYQQSTTGYNNTATTMPSSRTQYNQRAPATFHTGVTTFHGHLCYFSSFMTRQIHEYNTAQGAWQLLPTCPVINFGLEIVNQLVTTIGGRLATDTSSGCTAQLFSLSRCSDRNATEAEGGGAGERRWVEKVKPMSIARSQVATASNSRLVIVAGGEIGDYKTFIADIEVLLLETNTWYRVVSSPLGNYSSLSAVLCQDKLHLVEGCGVRERDRINTIHMGALVESIREHSTTRSKKNLPWKRIKSAPVSNTTCTCAKGKLLVVGGINSSGQTTNEIWEYMESGGWKTVGNLKTFRYHSLVGVTATGSLIVIGGLTKTKLTNSMEVFDAF